MIKNKCMDVKKLKQLLTKLELKGLEKENYNELWEIGDLMVKQGCILKSISEVNLIKKKK